MSFDSSSSVSSENNLSYLNQEDEIKPIVIRARRSPTVRDRRYKVGTLWINPLTNQSFQLTSVSNGTANWGLLGGTGGFPITPFVVGTSGSAGFSTIQAALDAANAAGGGMVQVQAGTYTENLTLYENTSVTGNNPIGVVTIVGVHTPPTSGVFSFTSLFLSSSTDIFNSTASGTASLQIIECAVIVGGGFTFNLPNWVAPLSLINSFSIGGGNGEVNNTTGSPLVFIESIVGDAGNTLTCSGTFTANSCRINCAVDFQSGSQALFSSCTLDDTVTLSSGLDNGSFFNGCNFSSDPSQAIVMNSANDVLIFSSSIDTSNTPSIGGTGAGNLVLSNVSFENDNTIAGTVNISGGTTRAGSLTATNGGIQIESIGSGIDIAEGVNARQGTATLVAGLATVATTAVTATSRIFITSQVDGGNPGFLRVSSRNVNTDFTITSSSVTDTSTVAWLIMEPA